jgi:arsenite-transporting ATPase
MSRQKSKIIMFTGKGGVGKTTMSVATALHYAQSVKTLIVSTDPSGSLSEIFHTDVSKGITPISPNLEVIELTRKVVLHLWREKFADEIYTVISSFLPVEKDIIDYIEGAPGIDEEFMLDYVLTLRNTGTYEMIIWDTAPTAATLNLLFVQQLFYTHLTQAQKLYLKVKGVLNQINPLELIHKWRRLTEEVIAMLKEDTSAWVVTNPERLPVEQALFIGNSLVKFGIPLNGYILNKMLSAEVCRGNSFLETKRGNQTYWQANLRKRTTDPIRIIPELVGDITARDKLRQIADLLGY